MIILSWNSFSLSSSFRISRTRSPRCPNRQPTWWVPRYRWVDRISPWWCAQAPSRLYVLTCPQGLQWQYTHPGWPHHPLRRPPPAFSSGRSAKPGRSWYIRCCTDRVRRWACIAQTPRSADPASAALSQNRRYWQCRCHHRLNPIWLFCSSWYHSL